MAGRDPLAEIRRAIIAAMASDDWLWDRLVLKGGNALHLVHGVAARTSQDLDFSIEGDFPDLDEAWSKIEGALAGHLRNYELMVFDFKLEPKPQEGVQVPSWWGGYLATFKIIASRLYEEHSDDIESLRRRAQEVDTKHRKSFKIDFSKHEYCGAKVRREVDDYSVYVYSLEMIAIEKMRAICQQMPEYGLVGYPRPRARDFYDIAVIVDSGAVSLKSSASWELLEAIFQAKEVPLELLGKIGEQREFHRESWSELETTAPPQLKEYDYYYDRVLEIVEELQGFRVE